MNLKALIGAGDRIMCFTLPFAAAGLAANLRWPAVFRIGLGAPAMFVGMAMLAIGVPIWFTSAVQLLLLAPKGKLIQTGPFALMRHPLYTAVALLVLPGCGLLFDSWLGLAIGLILYVSSRRFAPSEERELAARFGDEYARYRKRVALPWL